MIAVECGSNWQAWYCGKIMGFSWKNLGRSRQRGTNQCRSVSVWVRWPAISFKGFRTQNCQNLQIFPPIFQGWNLDVQSVWFSSQMSPPKFSKVSRTFSFRQGRRWGGVGWVVTGQVGFSFWISWNESGHPSPPHSQGWPGFHITVDNFPLVMRSMQSVVGMGQGWPDEQRFLWWGVWLEWRSQGWRGGRHEVGRPLAGYRLGHLASLPASVAPLRVVPSQVPQKLVGETKFEEACSTSMFLLGRYLQWVWLNCEVILSKPVSQVQC